MTNVQLRQQALATLDGSGNGTAKVGPLSAREVWHPDNVHVSVSGSVTNEAVCKIYVGDAIQDSAFRDATYSGSSGDATDKVNADTVKCAQFVWAQWTGGDPGHIGTMIVTGNKDL
jgi:hypothetical protein